MAGSPQPQVADLQTVCNSAVTAGADGPCRYDASITVPTFDSQVRPRETVTAPPVDQTYGGQWYDAQRDGEGISLEILPNHQALVYFFTFPPKGSADKQAWVFGVGDVVDNGVEISDVRVPSLDANGNEQTQHWGRIGLTFGDCSNGAMRWDGPDGWGSMEVPLTRVTSLQGLGCGIQGSTPPSAHPASGAWYDPTYFGRGFIFEQLDSQRIATLWFGFDNNGASLWDTGLLAANVDGSFSGTLMQPTGTNFGADFVSTDIHKTTNGTLRVSPFGCAAGATQYQAATGQLPSDSRVARIAASHDTAGLPGCLSDP